jgi:ribosome-binding factor A
MNTRNEKIAEQMQHELAQIIRTELRDPRVKLVTLTGVEVTSDLSFAKVYFSMLGQSTTQTGTVNGDVAATVAGLDRAAGFLRSALAGRITIRKVPKLSFHFDNTTERGNYLSSLIDQANATKALDSDQ